MFRITLAIVLTCCVAGVMASVGSAAVQLALIHEWRDPDEPDHRFFYGTFTQLNDVNGDGHSDGVIYHTDNRVLIFSGRDGSLLAEVTNPVPGTVLGSALAVGDLTGDARRELVISSSTLDDLGAVSVYSTSGTLLYSIPRPASAGQGFGSEMVVGDFVGDQMSEIVTTSFGEVHILAADGSHISDLQQPPGAVIGSPLEVGDFNGDGRPDLAVGGAFPPDEASVYIYTDVLGLPYSQLQPPAGYDLSYLAFPFAMASGDADNDTTDELWLSAFGYPEGGRVFRFSGSGVLEQTLITPIANSTFGSDVAAGDIDGDGRDEVAIGMIDTSAPYPSRSGHVLLFDYSGDLVAQIDEEDALPDPYPTTFFSQNLAMGDVTGDGNDDVLAEAPHGGAFFVFALDDEFIPDTPAPVGGSVELMTGVRDGSTNWVQLVALAALALIASALAALRLTRRPRP